MDNIHQGNGDASWAEGDASWSEGLAEGRGDLSGVHMGRGRGLRNVYKSGMNWFFTRSAGTHYGSNDEDKGRGKG